MKRALNTIIFLYPKAWRDRYESEFRALLDEVAPSWNTFLNVFGGAMRMQFKTGKSWKIVAACALAGVIAGLALTWTIPHRYVSTAVLSMGDIDDAHMNAEAQKLLARAPLTKLIMEADMYRDLRATTPLEDIIEQLKTRDIMIKHAGEKQFTVSVAAPDAERAQKATQILAADFLNAKVGTLIDPASLAVSSNGPRLSRNVVMGLIAGVVLGSLVALFAGLKIWKLAAGLGIAGAIAGAAVGYALPDRFTSAAVIRWESGDRTAAAVRVHELVAAVTADASLKGVVKTFQLYPGESGPEQKLREHLHFDPVGNGSAMIVRFDDRDRYVAQKVVADVVSRLIDESIRSVAEGRSNVRMKMELLDPASLPLHPFSPKREIVAGTGLFVGLLAAIMFGIWRYYRTPLPTGAAH
jgi:capsular polysaccharide biosynthesis protein